MSYACGNIIIKQASCMCKYLGIIFGQKLSWKEHINSVAICIKANVAIIVN